MRRLVTERAALLAAVAVGGLGLERHDELAFWIYVFTVCPAVGWVHGARWQRRWAAVICQPCRDREHSNCRGGTQCCCQHKTRET